MKNQQPKDIACKKIAWTIRNFSTLETNNAHYSEVFTIGDSAWQVLIYRGRLDGKSLALFLEVAHASSLPQGWSIYAEFNFIVVNQVSRERSITRDIKHKFCANEVNWGYPSYMPLSTLCDPSSGYILNDRCIIEVDFFVIKPEGTKPSLFEKSKEVPTSPNGELVDFKNLGQIEKTFVPLLEEVCLWHPSLIECQKNRSLRFTEWAFTALGQVLQFLKTKKWKDMNEDCCEHLQHLWEELEISRFDLTWLEPLVKSALGMKGYKQKAEKVKKLKENLVVLETEMKELRKKLNDIEESVENVRKDLAKEEEDFEEKDLDAEIGYGKP